MPAQRERTGGSVTNSRMDPFAEYQILTSRSGLPSAMHVPSQTLVHSRIDPWREAGEIAESQQLSGCRFTLLIGGGLGYLAEALLQVSDGEHQILVIEPDAGLLRLARSCRERACCFHSPWIRIAVASTERALQSRLAAVPPDANVIISPYLLRLSECRMSPMHDILKILRTEIASRSVYEPLLRREPGEERAHSFPPVTGVRLDPNRVTAVVGAGPSLDSCLDVLRRHRSRLHVVAASGAVPALMAGHVPPDWVIAMEAKETVLGDLNSLPTASRVVVFPSAHPGVVRMERFVFYSAGEESGQVLETRGGSSVIPELDFALRMSRADVVLVGLDLGYHNGAYARSSRRSPESAGVGNPVPPKFLAMRAGLERVLLANGSPNRKVYHVLDYGKPLKGTLLLAPDHLEETILSSQACEVESD